MKTERLEERLDAVISPIMNENTPGMSILISRGDDILVRKAYGMADLEKKRRIRPEDNFVIASNTKQFTCVSIMMMKEAGLLDYDEPIARFFPEFPSYKNYVTIRQLMTHRSGIKEYFEDDLWQQFPGADRADIHEMIRTIAGMGDLDFEPETQFSYCNSAYVMLGNIVEQLSGMPFGTFLKKRIFEPLGMNRTCAPDYLDQRAADLAEGYTLQKDGSFQKQKYDMVLIGYADGNMQSNVDDLLKWHKYLYMSDSEELIKRKTLEEAFEDNLLKDGSKTGYGFGFFLGENMGHREIWHTGGTKGFISRCSRFIDDEITFVMLTNYEGLPKNEMYEKIAKVLWED